MDAALPSRTTSPGVMSTNDVSDLDLLRLSRSRPRPILGWLSNGAAFSPLLVPVLGLPLLFAGLFGGMTTEGARVDLAMDQRRLRRHGRGTS